MRRSKRTKEKPPPETTKPEKPSSTTTNSSPSLYHALARERYDSIFLVLLLLFESIICRFILKHVSYTEIDWEAYMQEVDMFESGERDYYKIRGSTGPLVYPAGFLYLFSWLKSITDNGVDIAAAQQVFSYFYLLMLSTVLFLYTKVYRGLAESTSSTQSSSALVWSWRVSMGLCCLSKRLHSIFLLRLFNDGPAMLLLYLSVALFMKHYWYGGCFVYSLAVSIKMNILLFAPGLFLLLLQFSNNLLDCIVCLGVCAAVQVILGAPFLLSHPIAYLRKAFEFDRVFFYKWTVNWKFLPEDVFVSKPLSIVLLVLHLTTLVYLARRWLYSAKQQTGQYLFLGRPLSPDYIAYTLFLSNFVGICFARTLHYQFYSWYCSTIPFLLWRSGRYPILVRVLLVGVMEYAFLTFPATPTSSALLQVAHWLTLFSCCCHPGASATSPSSEIGSMTILASDEDDRKTSSGSMIHKIE